jgi:Ion channel
MIIFRLYFPLSYYTKESVYYSPRAARILHLYGLKTKFTFIFACKVIINDFNISEVLLIYMCVIFIYSHCLYIVSTNVHTFLDCFQIVIVTLPTVGYGEYAIIDIFPRLMIILILITGFSLNAFVTLTILKNF